MTGLGRGLSGSLARWRAPRAVHDRANGMSVDQVNEAMRLYDSGQSLARIAERFGVTATAVRARLRERGVAMRGSQGRSR